MRTFKEYAEECDFLAEVVTVMLEKDIDPKEFMESCIKECQPQLLNEKNFMTRLGNWFQNAANSMAQTTGRVGNYLDRQAAVGGIELANSFTNAYHYLNNALAILREYRKKTDAGDEVVRGVEELSQFVVDMMKRLVHMKEKGERVEDRLKSYAWGRQSRGGDWYSPPELGDTPGGDNGTK